MCENGEKVSIRVELEGELAESFIYIKRIRGLKHNSEVIRQLVSEDARREKQKEEASP